MSTAGSAVGEAAPVALPWTFDTTGIWHGLLKGAFVLNAVLLVGIPLKLVGGQWLDALGVAVAEAVVAGFTAILVRFQDGSRGTVFPDRVVVEPNVIARVNLPGPRGAFPLNRFRAVEVEFRVGQVTASANAGGPHELIRLLGRDGTPDILVARTSDRAGRAFGQQVGALLGLRVEERGAPREIHIG